MTRDETIEAIKVMQAYVDGETVQFQRGDIWRSMGDWPAWNFETTKYRIKPPPAELWVNFHDEYAIPLAYRSKEEAEQESRNGCRRVAVYMTEPGGQ